MSFLHHTHRPDGSGGGAQRGLEPRALPLDLPLQFVCVGPGVLLFRLFETLFYRYCEHRKLRLTERAGSRTLNGHRPASRFSHESDAVLATSGACVQVELKHLKSALGKNELLVFNQKGLDFLFADNGSPDSAPLYRTVVSATLLSSAARSFALQWGIIVVEPERLPLLLIHYLSGHRVEGLSNVTTAEQDEIWTETPKLITPLQDQVRQFSSAIDGKRKVLSHVRIEKGAI
jgi:hypothetical protein